MPLVVLSGYPCSGKSVVAVRLFESLQKIGKEGVIISESSQHDKNDVYTDARLEKDVRGFTKSEVQKLLSNDVVVIADSKNYIKGYRYELYCISKSVKTTQCTVQCDILPEDAWQRNLSLPPEDQYTKDVFDALVFRYEAPEPRNRWDQPLFIVRPNEEPPIDDIISSLFGRKPPPPNQSTQSQPLSATNFLYELDQATQQIVTIIDFVELILSDLWYLFVFVTLCLKYLATSEHIMETQKVSSVGQDIRIPGTEEAFTLNRHYTMAELSRLKRQFISYTKSHPVNDLSRLPSMFVNYLNQTLS